MSSNKAFETNLTSEMLFHVVVSSAYSSLVAHTGGDPQNFVLCRAMLSPVAWWNKPKGNIKQLECGCFCMTRFALTCGPPHVSLQV